MNHIQVPAELVALMKQLKLSGIGQTLAQRNREAIEAKLSYTEFFGLLLQDEILRREQKQFGVRLKQAGFKGNKTLESFDFTFNPKINQQLVKDLAGCRFIAEKAPVLIVGPCGTVKSIPVALEATEYPLRMAALKPPISSVIRETAPANISKPSIVLPR